MAVGKNITWKKGKENQCHLPFNIEAVGKNIKILTKNGGVEEIKVV